MDQLIDPTIADFQAEYASAVSRGLRWRSRWIWIAGHVAVMKVMAVHGAASAVSMLRDPIPEELGGLIQTLVASTVIMIIATVLLATVSFRTLVSENPSHSTTLAVYLIPSVLPLSIPIGLTFGIFWGLGRIAATRRSCSLILLLGLIGSLTSFVVLAWVAPVSNQAFRVSVVGRSIPPGPNELTLAEIRRLLHAGAHATASLLLDHHDLEFSYHTRLALGAAPLILALFGVAVTSRPHQGRTMPLVVGCFAVACYYLAMSAGKGLRPVSVFAAAWTPNIVFLFASVLFMRLSKHRENAPNRA